MERGFLLDHTHSGAAVGEWVEGEPKKSFWLGVVTRGRRQIPIQAYRCGRCGYLESFARE